jgi:hypothetical protein
LAEDALYGVDSFLEKFAAWTSYRMSGAIREISPTDVKGPEEIARTLNRANRILLRRLREIYDCRTYLIGQPREPLAEATKVLQSSPAAAPAPPANARPRRKSSSTAR